MLKFLRRFFYAGAAVFLVLFIIQLSSYFIFIKEREQFVQQKGVETAESIKSQVDEVLKKIEAEGNRLATLLGKGAYSAEQVRTLIKESAESIPEIQGVTACYEPYQMSEEQRLFCPYFNKVTDNYIKVGESYDYTDRDLPGTEWYNVVKDNGARWVEPYFARAAQDWYVDYGVPFYDASGRIKGTITMSFIASGFQNLVHDLSIGRTGYGFITSPEGTFLAHPFGEYVGTTSLKDIMNKESEPHLTEVYQAILDGKQGSVSFYDKNQKDTELFFYDKIPTSDWGLGVMFFKNDLLEDKNALNRRYIKLSLFLSGLLLFLLAIYFNKDHLDENEIWILSLLGSLLLLINIVFIGYLQHSASRTINEKETPPIIDLTNLASFTSQQDARADKLKVNRPALIPTGLYIHRLEFEDSYNINLGATIWQKYPLDISDQVEIGISFPQMSPFAEAEYIEESYRKEVVNANEEESYLLVGFDARVTLRLNFNYSNYPFDKRNINIELVPIDKNDNIIFTPDLTSYKFTTPSSKSGLDENIQISGNEVVESYYNYSLKSYTTDFGFSEKGLFEEVPILHFNINIRRKLINSFVTYLIPIFVVLIMMFVLVYASAKSSERQGIIESMAAFFFVLIFSHIDLRREVVTADLIYMEYFYFITYVMIILSTVNLIVFTKDKAAIFDFNDNQLYKASFFPFFFLMLLIITLVKFY